MVAQMHGFAPFPGAQRGHAARSAGHTLCVAEIALAALLAVLAVALAVWTRANASARVAATVRDLSAGLGRDVELAASLDPDVGDRMRSYLEAYQRDSHCTMLLATHNMGEVERMCTDVLMLRGGLIVDRGAPLDLISRYGRSNKEQVFLDVARKRHEADEEETG